MPNDVKDGKVVEPEVLETPSGDPTPEVDDSALAEAPAENKLEDQKFIPKERFDQVNDRMKMAEEARRRSETDMAQLRADMAALRSNQNSSVPESVIDPVKEFEGRPEQFVQHYTDKVKKELRSELEPIKAENKNLKFQLQVQEAAGRLEDFDSYREDIVQLINDPNFEAINPNKPGAIDLYYLAAKGRRDAVIKRDNLQESAPSVPHVESSRKRARPKAKDPREMSIDELRAHIGVAEVD